MKAFLRRWLGIEHDLIVARMRPDDVIIIQMKGRQHDEAMQNAQTVVQRVWPNHRVIVIDSETSLSIMRPEDVDALEAEGVEV
jgi:signal recognition particle GTPase